MNKVISLILLILISFIHFSCQSIEGRLTYLDYKKIPELTIKTPDLVLGILFSDDGYDFLLWTYNNIYIYSLKDNTPILYKKISNIQTVNGSGNDVYYPLFAASNKLPDSFKILKNYAKNAKKYSDSKNVYPIVNYKQWRGALNIKSGDFYIPINLQEHIYLDDIKDGGVSSQAMSAFDMNTWWTSRNYPKPDAESFSIPKYNIWKYRNGKVSSFTISPADLGMLEPAGGLHSAYISPLGKYVFIVYTSPLKLSGRYPTFGNLVKSFTNLFKYQKIYIAIVDVTKEKIILKKKFSSHKNYYPSYKEGFSISEKRKIFAYCEGEFIKFYHLDDKT